MESGLTVDFCGELYDLAPGDELTFGRQADLVVDQDNRFMHRRVGRFRFAGESWWIDNLGPHLPIEVDQATGAHVKLGGRPADGPAPSAALLPPTFTVTFRAGGFTYEILGTVEGAHPTIEAPRDPDDLVDFDETQRFGWIPLTAEERDLGRLLVAPLVADRAGDPESLPSNGALARQLGWTPVKYNRKLDHLCRRLAKVGVPGLVGQRGVEAGNRRIVLARHLLESGMIAPDEIG